MSDSEAESGEYKQNNDQTNNHDQHSPHARERSKSPGEAPGRSPTPRKRSYTRSRSRGTPRSRSPSYNRSRSRSPRRYSRDRHSYGRRSRSYDRDRRYSRRHSYSRSRSRSRSRGSRSPLSGRKRHIGDRMNPPSGKCLGVFGLSLYTTEKDLDDVFRRYGRIDKCNIVIDQKTGRSRGFGFVYFSEVDDAVEAKERANGMDLDGRKIRVDFSITKRAHTPTPGMYVGRPAPHYNAPSRGRYEDRSYGRDRYERDRYDYRDRYDSYRDDYRDRDRYRRSPSPYYSRRRSPSPYGRDRRY